MNKVAIGVVVVLVLVVAGFFLINSPREGSVTGSTIDQGDETDNTNSEMKTFVVIGGNFKFFIDGVENPEIRVKQGDKVRIEFINNEGFHDWKIDEFNAATEKIAAEKTSSVEFVADKKGTFEYYCSVGQHRAAGMFGKFVVE